MVGSSCGVIFYTSGAAVPKTRIDKKKGGGGERKRKKQKIRARGLKIGGGRAEIGRGWGARVTD